LAVPIKSDYPIDSRHVSFPQFVCSNLGEVLQAWWMPDIWLIMPTKPVTSEKIRDGLMKVAPGANIFVTPVATPPGGMTWALFAPTDWAEWLENWK